MNVIGIVCEYNPFHNGHKYQIDKIKEKYKDSLIIVCMSSSFTQRGNLSIVNKFDKTACALLNGVDLVLELPYVYSTQSSDLFAEYSIKILNNFKIDTLCFGSESNNLDELINNAKIQLFNKDFDKKVKEYMELGINYPTALNNALNDLNGSSIKEPNDLLALSYIKEILKNKYKIDFYPVKRTNDFHDNTSNEEIVSSSNIREKLEKNINISTHVPSNTLKYIKNIKYKDKYFELLKYKIINEDNLNIYLDVDEGLSTRIKNAIKKAKTLDELISNIKTKRYTFNKINRMLNHILCSYTKEEKEKTKKLEYVRVLGFSNEGKKYLSSIKKNIKLDILNKYDTNKYEALNIEKRVSQIYSILYEDIMDAEIRNNPIKKDELI